MPDTNQSMEFNFGQAPTPPRDPIAGVLGALASMGGGRIAAAMVDAFDLTPEKMAADEKRWLHGPVVVHQCGWTDMIPRWMIEGVPAERMAIVMGEHPDWVVGPLEIACVMMPATMEAPLNRDTADLYLWASSRAMAKHLGLTPEAFAERTALEFVPDSAVFGPRARLRFAYLDLCQAIRRKVARAQAARERN